MSKISSLGTDNSQSLIFKIPGIILLPAETLLKMFDVIHTGAPPLKHSLALAHFCKHWRTIALFHVPLWQDASIFENPVL